MSVAAAIKADSLARYFGERVALEGISFELPVGQTLTVLGENGAGKSTLLRVLATLLRPHGGNAEVLGEELPRNAWAVRGRVEMIGHDPMLYRDLTARENLAFSARLNAADPARVDELLARVELAGRAGDAVRTFSRGMVQRLSVCRALLGEPELLLLDEPLANLDPGGAELLAPLIGPEPGRSRVIVTHDIEYGLEQGDQVLGLKAGRAEFFGARGEVTLDQAKGLYR